MSKKRKRRILTFAIVLGIYCISYVVLSFCGGYRLIMFGRPNPSGLGHSDFVWQPRFGKCYQWGNGYAMDALGLTYFPLIYLDQKLVHQSRPYIEFPNADIDHARMGDWPPTELMHPTARRIIGAVDAARELHQEALDAARERLDFAEVSRIKKQIQDEAEKEFADRPCYKPVYLTFTKAEEL